MRVLLLSNVNYAGAGNYSAWQSVSGYLSAIADSNLSITAAISITGEQAKYLLRSGINVRRVGRPLPGILGDANLGYLPSILSVWHETASMHDVIHHYVYNMRGMNSVDILGLLRMTRGKPLVVGPAELPHSYDVEDLQLYSGDRMGRRKQFELTRKVVKLLRPLQSELAKISLANCAELVAVNEFTAAAYRTFFGRQLEVVVIPHGIWLNNYQFSTKPGRHSVLMVGNLIKRKGFQTAMEAVSEAKKVIPDISLTIVGEGPGKDSLLRLAKKLSIDSSTTIHDWLPRDTLRDLLSSCGLFCHASYSEGYSHTIVEAMASGRPIVCTNIIGSSGMVESGVNGLVVPPHDKASMAQAIVRILSDADLASKMGMASRRSATRYDWHTVANLYSQVYERLA